jgi:GntR family transcriptional regulator
VVGPADAQLSEPLLVLDPDAPAPPSEQIAEQLRLQIAAGRLVAGAGLPSVRQLARDLGIAPNTVVRAYGELERQGWIVASPRRGMAVADVSAPARQAERRREVGRAVGQLVLTARRLGVGAAEVRDELERQLAEQGG